MTLDDVVLRPATRADGALIAALIFELATYEKQPGDCHASAERLTAQLFERDPPAAECLIGEYRGEPVGFALWCHNFSTWECAPGLYLEDLFVRPQAQGKGVGKALFLRMAEIAVERGCARFEFSVLDWNTPSIAFYNAHGARCMDGWHVYRVDGEALLRLSGQ